MNKTYSQKASDVSRDWFVIDASTAPLGRIATEAAKLLTGKHKPTYTPHIDNGDTVVILNADSVVVTGGKMIDKKYYRHSGYPGSLKTATLKDQLEKDSLRVINEAVKGMLPKNKLSADRMKRLKVYKDDKHNHEAQKPTEVKVGR